MIYIDEREFLYCECDEKYVYSVPFSNEFMCMYIVHFIACRMSLQRETKEKKD